MAVDILLGLQWGDEGKGKIVDVFTRKYNIIARFQGGPNAGHTQEFDGQKHVLHTIPSGIFHENSLNIIGNGVVIDPIIFKREIEKILPSAPDVFSRMRISRKAHLILPTHRALDAASEQSKGKKKIGSTLKGIGPTYMDKTGRNGLRVGDTELPDFQENYENLKNKHLELLSHFELDFDWQSTEQDWFAAIEFMKQIPFIDSEVVLNEALRKGKDILAEGAQGSLLDIDFGTYPFVTSSNTTAAGACTGLGIAPNKIRDVFGIFKAYCTRVGSGPFPTELFDENGATLAKKGNEFGSTTGRPRRCGWIDLPALRYAIAINGVTQLIMMKADVLSGFEEIKACTAYEYRGEIIQSLPYRLDPEFVKPIYKSLPGWSQDVTKITTPAEFPDNLRAYINFLELELGVPISVVSLGPDRNQTIYL
jgi:adenylosuccinate synthase